MDFMTVKEVAEFLGVSDMTVRRYIQQGKLEGYQFQRDIKINKESVTKLIEESKIGGNENEREN